MDKNTIIAMQPSERVKVVNKMLKVQSLEEICEMLGFSSGAFSKIMREGDYIYHKADKQYYPFVRSEEERVKNNNIQQNDELTFIKNHIDTLKIMIQQLESSGNLLLDKQIYKSDAKYVNKSIRMNSDIYDDFNRFCKDFFPHLKSQDIIAQALIDAMKRYTPLIGRE